MFVAPFNFGREAKEVQGGGAKQEDSGGVEGARKGAREQRGEAKQ